MSNSTFIYFISIFFLFNDLFIFYDKGYRKTEFRILIMYFVKFQWLRLFILLQKKKKSIEDELCTK